MGATIMTTERALFGLLSWMSPSWPIGAFSHSSGLEWAVEAGDVTDRASTEDWIGAMLDQGFLWNDAVVLAYAWRAAKSNDAARLAEVAELAVASCTGHERRLEATAQGAAFRRIAAATTTIIPAEAGIHGHGSPGNGSPSPSMDPGFRRDDGEGNHTALLAAIDDDDLAYPVAAGVLFACEGVPVEAGLVAFLHGAVSNLVSAATRLVPLGQTDGQRILAALREPVLAIAALAAALDDGDPFDAMASAAVAAEIACMAHETQYTRLFRT
jgi:urease accessory protein